MRAIVEYIKEFLYVKGSDGTYAPSSKKFWFQLSQAITVLAIGLRFFGPDAIASRIDATLLGVLVGYASSTAGWYAWGKVKENQGPGQPAVIPPEERQNGG